MFLVLLVNGMISRILLEVFYCIFFRIYVETDLFELKKVFDIIWTITSSMIDY